jgi:hypothetical protein
MSDDKKIEKQVGDAMESYRVPPRPDAREAIRKQLVKENLLKGRGGRRYMPFIFIACTLAVLSIGVYLYSGMTKDEIAVVKTIPANSSAPIQPSNASHTESKSVADKNTEGLTNSTHANTPASENKTGADISNKEADTGNTTAQGNTDTDIAANVSANTLTKKKNKAGNNFLALADKKTKASYTDSPSVKTERSTGKNQKTDSGIQNSINENANTTDENSSSETERNNIPAKTQDSDNAAAYKEKIQQDSKATDTATNTSSSLKNISNQNSSSNDNTSTPSSLNQPAENNPTSSSAKNDSVASATSNTKSNTASSHQDSLAIKNSVLPDTTNKRTKSALKFSMDLSGGPLFISENYGSSGDPYFDEVKQSEEPRTTFEAAAGINVQFDKFIFQTALGTFLLKTDFSSSESTTSIDTSGSHYNYVDSSYTTFDSACTCTTTVTFHIDSTWMSQYYTVVSKQSVSASNQVSYLSIPFLIGYQFSSGKIDFEIKAGISVAILNKAKATLISPVDGTIKKYDSSNSPFRKSYLSFLASLAVHYNFSDRLSIFLQPAMKYGLSSIYKDSYPVSKRINSNSVNFGIRIHF